MPQLSIRTRLNLLIGALLLLALAANVALIVWSAGPRIRAEDTSILKVTRQTVERALADLQSSPDPARELAALLDKLSDVRHVRVELEPPPGAKSLHPRLALYETSVPDWFTALIAADRAPLRIPAAIAGKPLGTIVIAAKPSDEIAEIWAAASSALTGGLVLIAAVYALTTLAVRQALMPIQNLSSALRVMRDGNYEVELESTGPPELAAISSKLNELAQTLSQTRSQNSRLAGQIISVEDHERRELARELHDEFGPYLFAIRANVTALQAEAARDASPQALERARKCASTLEQISALQQMNRRVLHRLRPPALSELGLEGALHTLIALWRENNPGVTITLDRDELAIGETTALTIYRVVQEGLTNAFRHANASRIAIKVVAGLPGRVHISVRDNGSGVASANKPGFGLSGMSERVWALGGTLAMSTGEGGGVTLDVDLPLAIAASAEAMPPATRGFVAQTGENAHVSVK